MSRVQWPLFRGRPIVEVTLLQALDGKPVIRRLVADTGAGSARSAFELLLDEHDCLLCGGTPLRTTALSGAYLGSFQTYLLSVAIPALSFSKATPVVGLRSPPTGFDGIACFRFLNRFRYGNFGVASHFGLDI